MGLQELAQAVDGELQGRDVVFKGVSTDTRTLMSEDLFVALVGPNFDGHAFVETARRKRAAGALVDRILPVDLPQVAVNDTRLGLGRIAAHWRDKFDCPVVAVTGSNGKTTVKEMIGSILGSQEHILVSTGNLNNDIGLPLVLCRLREEHSVAVVEMGMSHPGEIDYLTRLARPQVAVITNAAPAHLEGLGSVAAIAQAKAEIFAGLAADGIAIVNGDDAYAPMWRQAAQNHDLVTFGIEQVADVMAEDISMEGGGSVFTLNTPAGSTEVTLSMAGSHNIMNALAAAAAAIAVGAVIEQVRCGLESMAPVKGRLRLHECVNGATLIDDSYNANPSSTAAAVRVLAAASGRKIFVLGDMKELGQDAEELHAQIGRLAKQAGINQLLTFGESSQAAAIAFGKGAAHFQDKSRLSEMLRSCLTADTTVLIKGSRGMRMEDVVSTLTDEGTRR